MHRIPSFLVYCIWYMVNIKWDVVLQRDISSFSLRCLIERFSHQSLTLKWFLICLFVTELAVPRLIGLVLRLDPTGLYQKSYPGSEGVTFYRDLITNSEQKRKWAVTVRPYREDPSIRIRDESLASLGSNFVSLGSSKTNAKW